jgi:hypothetical protein
LPRNVGRGHPARRASGGGGFAGVFWRVLATVVVIGGLATPAQADGLSAAASVAGQFAAVACASARECWAVGGLNTRAGLIEQWDGSAWQVVASPNPPGARVNALVSVACASAADCWAVGDYTNAKGSFPYADRWNGTAWSEVAMPYPVHGLLGATLSAVSCPSATLCFAAGNAERLSGHVERSASLIDSWHGRSWRVVADPVLPHSTTTDLQGLSCASASDCWATGAWLDQPDPQVGPYRGGFLGYHWDGARWTAVAVENNKYAKAGDLVTVSCPVTQMCMGIGAKPDPKGGPFLQIADQWNGSSWTAAQITINPDTTIEDISCATAAMCMATGSVAEWWNGTAWVNAPPVDPPGTEGTGLSGVTCPRARSCWAAGSWNVTGGPTNALIEHWNGTAWTIAQY